MIIINGNVENVTEENYSGNAKKIVYEKSGSKCFKPQAEDCEYEEVKEAQDDDEQEPSCPSVQKSFADYFILIENKDALLKKYQSLVKGKRGKSLALIMRCGLQLGHFIEMPAHYALKNEFGDVGSRQAYNKYVQYSFYPAEMNPIMEYLIK